MQRSYLHFDRYDRIERQRRSRPGNEHAEDREFVFIRRATHHEGRRHEERRPQGESSIHLDRSPSPEPQKKLDGSATYLYTEHEIRTVRKEQPSRSDEKPPSKKYVDAFVKEMSSSQTPGGRRKHQSSLRASEFQGTIIENPTVPDKNDPRGKRKPVTIPAVLGTGKIAIGEDRNGQKFFFRKSTKRGKKPPVAKEASSSSSSSS